MIELERYLGGTYSGSYQPAIMNETSDTFPDLYMPTIIPGTGIECPKTYMEMTYLEKNIVDEAVRQKMSKKDVNKTEMDNIYNLIVSHTNEQLHEKLSPNATSQAINAV